MRQEAFLIAVSHVIVFTERTKKSKTVKFPRPRAIRFFFFAPKNNFLAPVSSDGKLSDAPVRTVGVTARTEDAKV